jgi:hypothetical protein
MNDARDTASLRVLNHLLHGLETRNTTRAAVGLLVALVADIGRLLATSPTADALSVVGIALGALVFAYGAAPVKKDS